MSSLEKDYEKLRSFMIFLFWAYITYKAVVVLFKLGAFLAHHFSKAERERRKKRRAARKARLLRLHETGRTR